MSARHLLSVIVIAQDEADRIRPCLESVREWADEIVVVVAPSTDETAGIAREYTDRVVETPDWPGDGVQKQRALDAATGEWVLRIDADERVSAELRAEIEAVLERETIAESAFYVRWATLVLGRYLTRGECGVRHLNLFRREGASFSPLVVHSVLTPAPGPVGRLEGRLLHDAHRGLHHLVQKLNDYACFNAAERAGQGERASIPGAVLRGWWRFFKVYVVKRGFLDGWRGFLLASIYAHYAFTKHAALWAERVAGTPGPQALERSRPAENGEPGTAASEPVSGSTP